MSLKIINFPYIDLENFKLQITPRHINITRQINKSNTLTKIVFWYSLSVTSFRLNIQVLDIVQSFSTLAFTLVPPDTTIQVAKTWCLANLFGIVLKNVIVYSMIKLATFSCVVYFSPTEIEAYFWEFLNLSANESKTFPASD